MEDHNQSRNQTNSADEENVVELSAEMALPDQKKHKIIELTDDIDNPENQDAPPSEERPAEEEVADITENIQVDNQTDSPTPSAMDIEDIQATSEKEPPAAVMNETTDTIEDEVDAVMNETTDTIEDEVDAAFNAVAVPPAEPSPTVDDFLFDELSDITQDVDEAVGKTDSSDPTDEGLLPSGDAAPFDDDNLSDQAAEIEAAMAGDYDDKDKFAPPGVAHQQGYEISDDTEEIQEDDIIELVDVVDPSELDNLEAEETEETDIIELTQIVDIAELEGLEAEDQSEPAEAALDATQDHDTTTKGRNSEEVLTLSDIDDDSEFTGDIEASTDTDDIFDTAELDTLFDDDISENQITEAMGPTSDDDTIASDPVMEDANGLFDIVDDFDIDASPEEETNEDIAAIPSLEATDGLFDIEDQIDGSQTPEEKSSEPVDTDQFAPPEQKAGNQEQVIQLADILSTSKTETPTAEPSPIGHEEDMGNPAVDLETQDETDGECDSNPADDTSNENALFEDKKIEAAVEKIIRTKYADKLEQLIASAVEKAVTQEIENIKRTLSDTDNDELPS